MSNKKTLIFSSSLFVASCSLASETNIDLFKTTNLGSSEELKESILDINEFGDHTLNTTTIELCCSSGNSKSFKKSQRKRKRAIRRQKRNQKRSNEQ